MMARTTRRGTASGERARDAGNAPKLGLRFDRERTELVLDAPITLESGVRLDAMRTELAPIAGRLSLTEGWRAFRHRRSTLVSATVSVGLGHLSAMLSAATGVDVRVLQTAPNALSLGAVTPAIAIATELDWGWDGEDLLLVPRGARSVPTGSRAPLALVHDLLASTGARFDRERGVLRIARPLRRVLMDALVPAGIRLPSASGVSIRARVEGERVVLEADRTIGGVAETSRASLERARERASIVAACIDDDARPPPDDSDVAEAASVLADALAAGASSPEHTRAIARAASEYADRERHVALASSALLLAAERTQGITASRLAIAAIERGGLARATDLARAIELAATQEAARNLPWETLSHALARGGAPVARARGLALEKAGRIAEALTAFAEVTRAQPTDAIAQRGLARTLDALARHDEAIDAWDRAAEHGASDDAAAAHLAAARSALAAGQTDGAIARLRTIVRAAGDTSLEGLLAQRELARLLHVHRGLAAAIDADRDVARRTDVAPAMFAAEAASALREAIERSSEATEAELARSQLRALERVLGDAGASEIARLDARVVDAESRALASTDPVALRARADALRSAGEHAEAARLLVEVFARTRDAAVLRAAIELADRAGDRDARRAVFDRALALLPPGAARDAIAIRRG